MSPSTKLICLQYSIRPIRQSLREGHFTGDLMETSRAKQPTQHSTTGLSVLPRPTLSDSYDGAFHADRPRPSITTTSMTPTIATTMFGMTTKWSTTTGGQMSITVIPIAIFESCRRTNKRNTGIGGIASHDALVVEWPPLHAPINKSPTPGFPDVGRTRDC